MVLSCCRPSAAAFSRGAVYRQWIVEQDVAVEDTGQPRGKRHVRRSAIDETSCPATQPVKCRPGNYSVVEARQVKYCRSTLREHTGKFRARIEQTNCSVDRRGIPEGP